MPALNGTSTGSGTPGVTAVNTDTTNQSQGLYANSYAANGHAIFAEGNCATEVQANCYVLAGGMAFYGWCCNNTTSSGANTGVRGDGNWAGIVGYSPSANGIGVYGRNTSGSGGYSIYADQSGSSSNSLYCAGNGFIAGYLTKAGGGFRIDHPMDPANKWLNHSFVESPEMKNVYDGLVTLDASGAAVVTMPEYFETLNTHHRYQLTAIGASMPNLFVSAKMAQGQFSIAGGVPGGEVSWQVTGVRQDKWAAANDPGAEFDKDPEHKGLYMHPELFGLGDEYSFDHVRRSIKPLPTRQGMKP